MNEEKSIKSRIGILILSAVLLLTCVITGIYALYKSNGNEASSANAAKWGVTVTAQGDSSNLFKATYDGNDDVSVVSSNSSQLVAAPGTSGSTTFSITGQPEVAVEIAITLNDSSALSMIKGPGDATAATKDYTYYPVKWTLKKSSTSPSDWSSIGAVTDCDGVSLAAINNYLEGADVSKSWAANTDLTTQYGYYQLSWSWPAAEDHDAEDTYIGNVAAGTVTDSSVCITEAFKLKITVNQLDTYDPS